MKFTARIPVPGNLLALLLLITATGCGKSQKTINHLTKGYRHSSAQVTKKLLNRFQQSIALDPNSGDAKLNLATAYTPEVIPNLDTPENLAIAKKAMDGFNAVLAKDPNDLSALKQGT